VSYVEALKILVGNKTDLDTKVNVDDAAAFAKANNFLFYQVSAKEGYYNILSMFKSIAEHYIDSKGMAAVSNFLMQKCILIVHVTLEITAFDIGSITNRHILRDFHNEI
jgi:hypothetical protein